MEGTYRIGTSYIKMHNTQSHKCFRTRKGRYQNLPYQLELRTSSCFFHLSFPNSLTLKTHNFSPIIKTGKIPRNRSCPMLPVLDLVLNAEKINPWESTETHTPFGLVCSHPLHHHLRRRDHRRHCGLRGLHGHPPKGALHQGHQCTP